MKTVHILAGVLLAVAAAWAQSQAAQVKWTLDQRLGPLEIGRFALGQGGLSEEPMWADRAAEIRALKPRLIRLFLQEYFDPLPASGRHHWNTMDESVDLILKTGATPLMCIAFKPKVLFPKIDQKTVEPQDWAAWEKLIYTMVRHYQERGSGIRYWEISNEPDIGENGGCPYLFTAENYPRYYERTVAAILRADPDARVGGPALANPESPILPALLDHCVARKVPLHFVSWHIYNNDPLRIRATIDRKKALLQKYPLIRAETILNEWNMSLREPPLDPRFQPCFVAEVAYQMKEAGLDYSCYYHIRDYHVATERFARFMSPEGTALMTRWWNRMGQFDGLFDFQNRVRPAYFLFKLLSRLDGVRLAFESSNAAVHGLAAHDEKLHLYNLLLWNFSKAPARVELTIEGAPAAFTARRLILDAAGPSDDENSRLRPQDAIEAGAGRSQHVIDLDGYDVVYWSLERRR